MSDRPMISIITPSLNTGKFLRDTIESILNQSFTDYEHIIVDGGSTDGTLDILKEYPHIKWVSEKEEDDVVISDVFRRAFDMSRGKYIIQCCISDGFLDKDWFKRCVRTLESDENLSLVWGLPQYMTEEGDLGKISYGDFFDDPPPQDKEFLSFWLATGFFFPEGNYCMRREVFDHCFPKNIPGDEFKTHPVLGVVYNFNTLGYLSRFLPIIANYGRLHGNSRQLRRHSKEYPIEKLYYKKLRDYKKNILRKKEQHVFRNGKASVIDAINPGKLLKLRLSIWKQRVSRSQMMRTNLATIYNKLRQKGLLNFLSIAKERFMRI